MHRNLVACLGNSIVVMTDWGQNCAITRKRRAALRDGPAERGAYGCRESAGDAVLPRVVRPVSVAGSAALRRCGPVIERSRAEARPFSQDLSSGALGSFAGRHPSAAPGGPRGERPVARRADAAGRGSVESWQAARRAGPLVRGGSLRGGSAGRAVIGRPGASSAERPTAFSYRSLAAPKASGSAPPPGRACGGWRHRTAPDALFFSTASPGAQRDFGESPADPPIC